MSEMISWFKERKVLHVKYAFKIILGVMEILKSLPSLVDIDIREVSQCQLTSIQVVCPPLVSSSATSSLFVVIFTDNFMTF